MPFATEHADSFRERLRRLRAENAPRGVTGGITYGPESPYARYPIPANDVLQAQQAAGQPLGITGGMRYGPESPYARYPIPANQVLQAQQAAGQPIQVGAGMPGVESPGANYPPGVAVDAYQAQTGQANVMALLAELLRRGGGLFR